VNDDVPVKRNEKIYELIPEEILVNKISSGALIHGDQCDFNCWQV